MAKQTEEINVLERAEQARRDKKRAQNAAARRRAAADKAVGNARPHTQPGVDKGLGSIAKREQERKLKLAGVRAEQADEAMVMMPELLPGDLSSAHEAFAAIVAQFRTAEARKGNDGRRMSATEVAVQKAKLADRRLFDAPMAEDGIRAVKKALWRAGTPAWEAIEKSQREERARRQKRRQPQPRKAPAKLAAKTVSPQELERLRKAVKEANLNVNLVGAGMHPVIDGKRLNRKAAEDRQLAAEKALTSATAA